MIICDWLGIRKICVDDNGWSGCRCRAQGGIRGPPARCRERDAAQNWTSNDIAALERLVSFAGRANHGHRRRTGQACGSELQGMNVLD